jgi:hypothetical protein
MRSDFETDEEYESAKSAYECAEDMYAEEYIERKRGFC